MHPQTIFEQNGVITCNLGVPKYVISNQKINNCKEKQQQENLIAIFVSQIKVDEHVSTKISAILEFTRGVWGLAPQKQIFFKNQTK